MGAVRKAMLMIEIKVGQKIRENIAFGSWILIQSKTVKKAIASGHCSLKSAFGHKIRKEY